MAALDWRSEPYTVGTTHDRPFSGNLPRTAHPFRPGRPVMGERVCRSCGMYQHAADWSSQRVHPVAR